MTEREAAEARARAQINQLKQSITPNAGRYAGATLLATLAPTIGSMVDNQEENLLNSLLSGGITYAGMAGGAAIGMNRGSFQDEAAKDAYVRTAISDLKKQAQVISAKEGPQAAADFFGEAKRQLMHDVSPINQKIVDATNRAHAEGKAPRRGDDTIFAKTPRQVNGSLRGMALGALASALPAYLAMRGGDIEG